MKEVAVCLTCEGCGLCVLVAGGGGGPHHHRAARPGAVLGCGWVLGRAGRHRAQLAGEGLQLGLQRRLVTATARICNTRGHISSRYNLF